MSIEIELVETASRVVTSVESGAIGVVKIGPDKSCHFAVGSKRLAEQIEILAGRYNRSLEEGQSIIYVKRLKDSPIGSPGVYWFYGHPINGVLGFLKSLDENLLAS